MANVASLKKKAAEFEAKKQIEKAIVAYREILDAYDSGEEADPEIALYNRVGDLLTRLGNTAEAVTLYERAVDLYTEGGFFNNAIALCNKVLRASPGRASIYYKLGKISAAKGFKSEAKENFLEYADRMQKGGKIDEAFRALKEFAELVPDQDDVRLMLAEQLTKAGKQAEALQQLEILYGRYENDGQTAEAQATAERMKAIDPTFEPKAGAGKSASKDRDDLIFIDLDAPPRRSTRSMSPPPAAKPAPPVAEVPEPVDDIAAVGGLELTSTAMSGADSTESDTGGSLLGLEPTSFAVDEPEDDSEPLDAEEFSEIDLSSIAEAKHERDASIRDLALGGDLPTIDVSPRASGSLVELDLDDDADAGGEIPLLDVGVEPTALDDGATPGDLPLLDVDDDEPHAARTGDEIEIMAPDDAATYHELSADEAEEPPPPVRRSSSILAANSVLTLRVKVEDAPEDWALRRQLGEALLEGGERDEGMRELEAALAGFDKNNDIASASSIADEIVRINPLSVRYHQKRVEYAFRANDKVRTAKAYLALADALLRDGQSERARSVYQRVLEIEPGQPQATAALENFLPASSTAPQSPGAKATPPKAKRYSGTIDTVPAKEPSQSAASDDDEFVSLGDWLREDEGPKSTRMVVAEEEPTGDEQADFADMLKKFKQGISENVDEEDHESHYDLGVAFKEMGLVDEAIAEFQKALRGTQNRARTYEALGQCFLEKKQLPVATTILTRALNEPNIGDEQLVGVLYLLGYIHESTGKPAEAKGFYERVFAVDIQFRDVGDRLNAVDKAVK